MEVLVSRYNEMVTDRQSESNLVTRIKPCEHTDMGLGVEQRVNLSK